jgi:DNA-3-methyladenine glycosylase I
MTPPAKKKPKSSKSSKTKKPVKRCQWACATTWDADYHDKEWGVPSYDDRHLFEMLILEGAQAGLSWLTILKKRDRYREVYKNFDVETVARFTKRDQQRLLKDPGIVRNRLKVAASVSNARAFLEVQAEFGSFSDFLWPFVDGKPKLNRFRSMKQIPAETEESQAMSKALKKRGFRFVGPTICYALMQSVGMVNDHEISCFRYKQV